jgi:hypothetical protein
VVVCERNRIMDTREMDLIRAGNVNVEVAIGGSLVFPCRNAAAETSKIVPNDLQVDNCNQDGEFWLETTHSSGGSGCGSCRVTDNDA